MFNFSDIHQLLLQGKASIEVETPAQLADAVVALFQDENLSQSMAANGRKLVEENRGALQKVLGLVGEAMKGRAQ